MEAFNNATQRSSDHDPKPNGGEVAAWKKPPQGSIKINWDAAVDKQKGKIGMGVIARDHSGQVIAMLSGPKEFIDESSLVEALVAREAVYLCISLRLQNCILDGNALEVVNAINQEGLCRGTYGQITTLSFSWIKGAAHQLVKMGLQLLVEKCWFMEFPSCFDEIVLAEQV
jgi:hypothetical protein